MYLKRLAVVALALTHIAENVDIRQKIHLNLPNSISLTLFTSTASHVKAEAPGPVAPNLRLR